MSQTINVDTDIGPSELEGMLNFIQDYYVVHHPRDITEHNIATVDQTKVLSFTVSRPDVKTITVEILALKPIQVKFIPPMKGAPSPRSIDQLRAEIETLIKLYEESLRRTTVYFAGVVGERVTEVPPRRRQERGGGGLLTETMMLLNVAFLLSSILLWYVIGSWTPLVLLGVQVILVLNSDKLVMRMGAFPVSKEEHDVQLFEYRLSAEEIGGLIGTYSRAVLRRIQGDILERTLSVGKSLDQNVVAEAFAKYGVNPQPEKVRIKTVNVYRLVETAAQRFNLPIPKITISSTMLPNAAASGPGPRRGVILLTIGLLLRLRDDEVLSIVGHEFSHIKGRDPLALFFLTALQYTIQVYLLYSSFMFFILGLVTVYFIAKFFEAKCDLESSHIIGQPKILAESLRKIGFRRLFMERVYANRFQGWIGLDAHPPIYFRVKRLEKLNLSKEERHPFIRSVWDCIVGFFSAIKPIR